MFMGIIATVFFKKIIIHGEIKILDLGNIIWYYDIL